MTTISIIIQCNIDIYIVEKVFTGLIAFGSGCIIAKYRDHIENMLSTYRRVLNIIALISFFLCFSVERSNVILDSSFFLVAFRTMSVVVYTVMSYIIVNSVIVYIPYGSTLWNLLFKYGNISYTIYLIHNPYIVYPAWIISITLLPNALIAEVVALILSYFVCMIGGTMVCMLNIGKYVIGQKELLRIGRR